MGVDRAHSEGLFSEKSPEKYSGNMERRITTFQAGKQTGRLRKHSQSHLRRAFFPLVAALLLSGTVFAPPLSATVHRAKDRVTVSADSRIDDDLLITAGTCKIDGFVDGEVFSFSKDFRLSGTITGAGAVFAQTATIDGDIYHSLGMFSQRAFVSGTVRGSGYIFAEKIEIDDDALFQRDASFFGDSLFFGGEVSGKLQCVVGAATISGIVGRDLEITSDRSLRVLETAKVGGDLIVHGSAILDIEDGAEISGEVIRLEEASSGLSIGHVLSFFFSIGALFLLAVVTFSVARAHFQRSLSAVRKEPLRSLAFGLITFMAGLFVAFMLAITIVGLLAASILIVVLLGVLFLFGPLYVAGGLGEALIAPRREPGLVLSFLRILTGIVLIALLTLIPYAGVALYCLAGFIGLGAFVIAARDVNANNAPPNIGGQSVASDPHSSSKSTT